jgi:hypothetical protein
MFVLTALYTPTVEKSVTSAGIKSIVKVVTDVAEEFAASIFRLLVVLEARIYFGIEISVSRTVNMKVMVFGN